MKRLTVILAFLTSGLFGQDSPMFDSVDYFVRNKIKKVRLKLSPWYYGLPYDTLSFNFDKKNKPAGSHMFETFRDTIKENEFGSKDTVRNYFDRHKRIIKSVAVALVRENPNSIAKIVREVYTRTYSYADSTKNKIKKIVWETPYFVEEKNFYYDKYSLSLRTTLNYNKITNKTHFETTSYDYYPDKKLKRETRRVADSDCPGNCVGVIEYTYETDK